MKLYTLFHPDLGYVAGKRGARYFTQDVQMASKWNRASDASNCRVQTHYPALWKFSVICYEVNPA